MSTTIYQKIWTADQSENGVPAILPGDVSTPRDKGYVIVDESTPFNEDTRVLREVFIPDEKKRTYELCEKLYNNYNIRPSIKETETAEEEKEIEEFINAIKDTAPMKIARQFIDPKLNDDDWKESIKSKWFTTFRNDERSGFEHVFVGEKSSRGNNELGGYHFWHKYYLDDGAGKVDGKDTIDYFGPNYENNTGVKVPDVVTLRYTWEARDENNNTVDDLEKWRGGFWVGCSPEGLIALGMARFDNNASSSAVINGAEYNLILPKDDKGEHIKTFYPKFKRIASAARGSIRIVAALINPEIQDDPGNETVTLINTTNVTINCTNWKIVDKNDKKFTLDTTFRAGDAKRITLSGAPGTAQLGNRRGGEIILEDDSGNVIDEVSYTRAQAKKEGITVLF